MASIVAEAGDWQVDPKLRSRKLRVPKRFGVFLVSPQMYRLQLHSAHGETLECTLTTGDGSNRAAIESIVAVTTSTAPNNTGDVSCGVSRPTKRLRPRAGESRSRAWDNSKSAEKKRQLYRASEGGYNADLKSAAARQPCLGKTQHKAKCTWNFGARADSAEGDL